MQKRNIKTLAIWIVAVAITASSCGSSKKVVNDVVPQNGNAPAVAVQSQSAQGPSRLARIVSKQGGWTTMQAGGSVSIGGARSFSSSMQIRMVRDRAILISLRPILGIEAGRLIITGDTIIVIDKLHKQYIQENVSLITNGIPATVSTVQDLFLGRAFLLGGGDLRSNLSQLSLTEQDGLAELAPIEQPREFSYSFTYGTNDKILSVNVVPSGKTATIYKADYTDVRTTLAGNVAGNVSVSTELRGTRFTLELDYDEMRWNQPFDIDATIPAGYKKISGKNLLNMLG